MMSYTESDVDAAFEQAPELVQEALSGGIATDFIVGAQARYGLHVDVVGTLSFMVRDLLIGLMLPTEFYEELISLGMDQALAQKIVTDVNTEVFMPLRQEMEKQGITQTIPVRTTPAPVQAPLPVREPLVPVPAPMSVAPLPQSIPAPQPEQPVMNPQIAVPVPQPGTPAAYYHPQTQWPGHPGANWQPAAAVHVYVPTGGFAPHPGSMPVGQHLPPTPEQPAARVVEAVEREVPVPPPVAPVPPIAEMSARPLPPPPPNLPGAVPAQTPIEKSYGNDPYREPV